VEIVSALSIGSGLGVPIRLDKAIAPHQYCHSLPIAAEYKQPMQMPLPIIFVEFCKPPSLNQEDNFNNTFQKYVVTALVTLHPAIT